MDKRPWLKIAKKEIGVKEVPGPGDNPQIVKYLKSTSLGKPDNENDETPWCSAFVNWVIENAGFKGTNSAWARSWLGWGREPGPFDEWVGCLCILERGENAGHVGFLVDWDDDDNGYFVKILGGNQGNAVSEVWFNGERVLGYRVPREV